VFRYGILPLRGGALLAWLQSRRMMSKSVPVGAEPGAKLQRVAAPAEEF